MSVIFKSTGTEYMEKVDTSAYNPPHRFVNIYYQERLFQIAEISTLYFRILFAYCVL